MPKREPKVIQLIVAPWDRADGNGKKFRTSTMYALRDDGAILVRRYDEDSETWTWEVERP